MAKNRFSLFIMAVFTALFCFAIALNITSFLRGPNPYPPGWRWPYQFVNTLARLWAPLIVTILLVFFFKSVEQFSRQKTSMKLPYILGIVMLLHYTFQFAVLYFSRTGINGLIGRIINPDLNGYFTTALHIRSIPEFLRTYNRNVLSFSMHATGHPPGAILFFVAMNQLGNIFFFFHPFVSRLHPGHADIRLIWNTLSIGERTGALLGTVLIPLLSSASIIPIYFIAKRLYSIPTAIRAVFLYCVVPSIILFIPISDVFFPLLPLIALWFLLIGMQDNHNKSYVFSGLTMFAGLFFSMSLLPLLFIFVMLMFYHAIEKNKLDLSILFKQALLFGIGFLVLPILLLIFFGFNSVDVARTLMSGLPKGRQYQIWVFYNLYDFFVFSGISYFVLFVWMFIKKTKDYLFIGFTLMLFLLDISGSVRGETGRIWLPFTSFMVIFLAAFITRNRKFSGNIFLLILALQIIQILVMQEFWVMLW